jgi:hypothetical protein
LNREQLAAERRFLWQEDINDDDESHTSDNLEEEEAFEWFQVCQ